MIPIEFDDEGRRVSRMITTGSGFTESFSEREIEVLVYLGLIKFKETQKWDTWVTHYYVSG